MNIVDGNDFLIKYLGLIFVSAGIARYFLYDDRKKELNNMNLSNGFDYIIIELIIGFTLFFNITDRLTTLLIFLIFLSIGTILILFNNFNNIISEINTVFTFQPTAMCFVLHFTYIIMIIGICLNLTNTSKNKISTN